jgi:hypothetical protein
MVLASPPPPPGAWPVFMSMNVMPRARSRFSVCHMCMIRTVTIQIAMKRVNTVVWRKEDSFSMSTSHAREEKQIPNISMKCISRDLILECTQ